jgi:uncharacterized lipoprotein YmbA
MMRRMVATVSLLLPFLLGGCGSPPTEVFDLSPATESAPLAVVPSRAGPLIYVDKPAVAGYFDRTQMVTRSGDSRVSIHEFEVWSDPPADLIARAIVDDLSRRFGADKVMTTPVEHYATPDWRVELNVLRFDVDESGQALLDARWTLLAGPNDRLAATRRERIETSAGDTADPKRRVAALREAVAILANRIGDAIDTAGRR